MCVLCMCTLSPLWLKSVQRLAGNFCQYLTAVTYEENSMVWVSIAYGLGLHSVTGGESRGREGAFPPLGRHRFSHICDTISFLHSWNWKTNKMSTTVSQRIGKCCGPGGVVIKFGFGSLQFYKRLKEHNFKKNHGCINPGKKVIKSKKSTTLESGLGI
jgi:hypothetical protein